MKRILVTGGAGFLGAHLCERLLEAGGEVLCVDDFSTGRRENIARLIAHPRFNWVEHDVTLQLEAGRWADPQEIYNLACPASPPQYQADPVKTMKTSVLGAINVLELARSAGAKVLQASTSEVYGDPLVHPQTEAYWGNVNPIGPRACYDEGKRAAETLFFDYRRQYGVDTRVARIFNTYGPGMREDDGRVVSNFICQALRGAPITIYGDGNQTRSLCYVSDTVDGLIRVMASKEVGPVNVGNPQEGTVGALAILVRRLTDSDSRIEVRPLPKDDPCRRRPDIEKLEALGWRPTVSLVAGLQKTIQHFRAQIGRPYQLETQAA